LQRNSTSATIWFVSDHIATETRTPLMYTEAQSFTKNPKLSAWDFLVYGLILYHPVKFSKYILPLLSCAGISSWGG